MQSQRSRKQSGACASQNREQSSLFRRFSWNLPAPREREQNQHEQHRDDDRSKKRKAHVLFAKERNTNSRASGETTCHGSFCLGSLQEPKRNENPECALAVVFGNRNDAVDTENSYRRRHKQRNH